MATATRTRKPAAKTAKAKAPAKPKRDLYQELTDQVIEMLEAGTAPWHKPWRAGQGNGSMPRNMVSGKVYRGSNPMFLSMVAATKGYTSPFWATYRQIMTRLGVTEDTPSDDPRRSALAGQKGALVVFWKPIRVEDKKNDGSTKMIFMLRHYYVFNADQVAEGLDLKLPEVPEIPEFELHAEAELAMKNYFSGNGPKLIHGWSGDAFYTPATDTVSMPEREDFESPAEYYGTLFHEATHSTGHESRLNRSGITELGVNHVFGSPSYAKEELVAEMGAAFLSALTGVQASVLPNSAAYLANWIKVLKDDNTFLLSAAAQAQKAAEHILGTTPVYDTEDSSEAASEA